MAWRPDPRECKNCEGFGFIVDWSEGQMVACLDCDATGTEYAEPWDPAATEDAS